MKMLIILSLVFTSAAHAQQNKPKISIRDAGGVFTAALATPIALFVKLGNLVFEDGKYVLKKKAEVKPDASRMIKEAEKHNKILTDVHSFYLNEFGRASFDGRNSRITSYINLGRKGLDIIGLMENAAWLGIPYNQFVFGMGAEHLGEFTTSYDVIGHEFTHAVIEYTSNLQYNGQSGALNEHLADVFGEYFQYKMGKIQKGKEFLIGEEVVKGATLEKAPALRNMLEPSKGAVKQPATMSEIDVKYSAGCVPTKENDLCGVHILSGIPNKVIATVAKKHGWDSVVAVVYPVMTKRLTMTSSFTEYRTAILSECSTSNDQELCDSLQDAFDAAGIN